MKSDKKAIAERYKQWCKETKRNGNVLVGKSIQEFFEYLSSLDAEGQGEERKLDEPEECTCGKRAYCKGKNADCDEYWPNKKAS